MPKKLDKAKENMIKKMLDNMNDALLAKKYYLELEKLIKNKRILSIEEVSKKLNVNKTDVLTIFEELILYHIVSGKIEEDKLILDF